MNPESELPITELELLLTDEQRATRRVSVEEHLRFQQALINDLIDDLIGELRQLKPEDSKP